jgi:hypothetical protein
MIFAACVGCPGPPPAELWQIAGLAAVGAAVLVAFGIALLALDRLSG